MLSRVADALYWMGRYIERAEQSARVLEVTREMLFDLGEVDPSGGQELWNSATLALGFPPHENAVGQAAQRTAEEIVYDENAPSSVISSISRARENARQVREVISSEMWEQLNKAYWLIKEASGEERRREELSQTLETVLEASLLWSGVTDATMRRGEGWLFVKLGQFVERADRSCRIIAARSRFLDVNVTPANESRANLAWVGLLRTCGSLEAYRKVYPRRVAPKNIITFLVLDRDFPRTVRYSVAVASSFVDNLGALTGERVKPVKRAFGRLSSHIEYADVDEVIDSGVGPFLEGILGDLGRASLSLQRAYFLH